MPRVTFLGYVKYPKNVTLGIGGLHILRLSVWVNLDNQNMLNKLLVQVKLINITITFYVFITFTEIYIPTINDRYKDHAYIPGRYIAFICFYSFFFLLSGFTNISTYISVVYAQAASCFIVPVKPNICLSRVL